MSEVTLITGATGFIGRFLVERLLPRGGEIRCLVRPTSDVTHLEGREVQIARGDLLNPGSFRSALTDVGTVYHLAGAVYPQGNRDPQFYSVNPVGTRNLAESCLAARVRKIVYVSSIAACIGSDSSVVDEETLCTPITRYGRSKLEAEGVLIDFARHRGLPVVIVRAPLVYGPHQPRSSRVSFLFRVALRGIFCGVGDGENLVSLCYIDNLIDGLLLAERDGGSTGEIFFISDETPYSVKHIVTTIAREGGVRLTYVKIPQRISSLVAPVLPRGARKLVREMGSNWACSIARARERLDYRPRVSLEEGVRRTLQHCGERDETHLRN